MQAIDQKKKNEEKRKRIKFHNQQQLQH